MSNLVKTNGFVELAVSKPTGLNDLGVPVVEGTVVKKGKLPEMTQKLDDDKVGRMYQNIRAFAIKTKEGDLEVSQLFVLFEVFSDDCTSVGTNSGVEFGLYNDQQLLTTLQQSPIFVPYARCWYDNRYVYNISNEVFDALTRVDFVAKPDEMRAC